MNVSVSDAKAKLTELVRLAEAGEDVILTRHGLPAVKLVAIRKAPTSREKQAFFEAFRARLAKLPPSPGPSAARSQDFLYGDDGLPI